MKKAIILFSTLLLGAGSAKAQNVDIYLEPNGSNTLDVYLQANGASYTSQIFNGLVFTVRWESAAGYDIGSYTSLPFDISAGLAWSVTAPVDKEGPEVTNGGFDYQTFAFAPGQTFNPFGFTNTKLDDGVKTLIGSIDVSGAAAAGLDVCSFKYSNDSYTAPNNRNFYVEIAGADVTGNTAARSSSLVSTYTGSWDVCELSNLEAQDTAIISSGYYTLSSDVSVDYLEISAGAGLEVSGGTNLSVTHPVKLHADASNYAQYVGPALSIDMDQYVGSSAGWRHLGIPVSENIGTALSLGGAPMNYTAQQNLFIFNTTDFQWNAVSSASTNIGLNGLAAFMGGSNFPVSNGLVNFSGTSKAGNHSTTYNWASSPRGLQNYDGWNFFANPYPCNLDFNRLDDQDNNAFSSYSVWDPNAGVYRTWNGVEGTFGGQRYIAPGQGFWIKSATGNGKGFDFAEADRTTDGGNAFVGDFKTSSSIVPLIRLSASTSSGGIDETVIYFPQSSTDAFDQQSGDAFKPWNMDGTNMFSYPKGSTEQLAINAYGMFDPTAVIPLGFDGDTATGVIHTISINTMELDPMLGIVYLEDLLMNKVHNLSDKPYKFSPSSAAPLHRFNIRFGNTVGIDDADLIASDLYTFTREGTIQLVFVNPTEERADVRLFNMAGQLVHEGFGINTENTYGIPSHRLAKGLYTIEVAAPGKPSKMLKVVIN